MQFMPDINTRKMLGNEKMLPNLLNSSFPKPTKPELLMPHSQAGAWEREQVENRKMPAWARENPSYQPGLTILRRLTTIKSRKNKAKNTGLVEQ